MRETLLEIAKEYEAPMKAIQYLKNNCHAFLQCSTLKGLVIYPSKNSKYKGNVEIVVQNSKSEYINYVVNIPEKGKVGLPFRSDNGSIIGLQNKPKNVEWIYRYPSIILE